MRKMFGLTVAVIAAVVLTGAASPTPAAAADTGIGEFCNANASRLGLTQGACVRSIATQGPALCRTKVGGVEWYAAVGYANRGQCVSAIQKFVREFVVVL